jgi:hypothetical protein
MCLDDIQVDEVHAAIERRLAGAACLRSSRRCAPAGPVQIIARLRVALGFTCGVLVLWLATPTRTSDRRGPGVAAVGEGSASGPPVISTSRGR